jgi:hypothetical protein
LDSFIALIGLLDHSFQRRFIVFVGVGVLWGLRCVVRGWIKCTGSLGSISTEYSAERLPDIIIEMLGSE